MGDLFHGQLEDAVRRTMEWYRSHAGNIPVRDLCLSDIHAFVEAAR
jgi:hypothetical protein